MTREERELAIDIFEDNFTVIDTHGHYTDEEECLAIDMAIKALEQEPKIGHWIMDRQRETRQCDKCMTVYRWSFNPHNYCPNCGARMQAESEE